MKTLLLATLTSLAIAPPAQASLIGPEPVGPISYGPQATETVTVLPAPSPPSAATVVFVHGGWWVEQPEGEVQDETPLRHLQSEDNAAVVLVQYPQACRARFLLHCGLEETEAVIRAFYWAHEHIAEYGGNPNDLQLFGASAGGQLVERAANMIEAAEPNGILGSVTELSAPGLNFVTFAEELVNRETAGSGGFPTAHYLGCTVVNEFEGCRTTPEQVAHEEAESPIFNLPPAEACAPQFVAWGEINDLVDKQQSMEFANALEAAHCPVTRHPAHGGHAIQYWVTVKRALFPFWNAH